VKTFDKHEFSIEKCAMELADLKNLLVRRELGEREDILPFFRKRIHLSLFLSSYAQNLNPDLLAFEYDLFGDFTCDLVVGDSTSHNFLFVEFEDAKKHSVFTETGKYTPEWSSRIEHGFSQVIDWFWKLEDQEKSDDYEHRFGSRHATTHGLVVVGRDDGMAPREVARLKWRQDRVVVHSKKISVVIFDGLERDLRYRLSLYSQSAKIDID
jgi:Domain of unknown function (DUF4263)